MDLDAPKLKNYHNSEVSYKLISIIIDYMRFMPRSAYTVSAW